MCNVFFTERVIQKYRVNESIRVREVRLIDDAGEMMGVMTITKALELAAEKGLDLVEVSPNASPPVCKILDYGKFKFNLQKKESEAKKKQVHQAIKEIQLRPNIGQSDFDVKCRAAEKFLKDGHKVKVVIKFKGREIINIDSGYQLINKLKEKLENFGIVEVLPKSENKQIGAIISPNKRR